MRVPFFWDTLYRRSQGKHRRSRSKDSAIEALKRKKKGVQNQSDCTKQYHFAKKCQKITEAKIFFYSNISFHMDGVSFVFKRKPMQDPTVPKGNISTKRSGGCD